MTSIGAVTFLIWVAGVCAASLAGTCVGGGCKKRLQLVWVAQTTDGEAASELPWMERRHGRREPGKDQGTAVLLMQPPH